MFPALPKLPPLPKTSATPPKVGFPMTAGPVAGMGKAETSTLPPMPDDFVGTLPEWLVWWWLTKRNIEFEFQTSQLGGRKQIGGMVFDFMVYDRDPGLAINVQGEYWHFGSSGLRSQDLIEKIAMLNQGYDVVFVRESDLYDRLDYTMRRALEGVQLFED